MLVDGRQELADRLDRIVRRGSVSGVDFRWQPDCPDVFDEWTDLPMFDSAIRNPHNEAVVEVCVDPVDWLRIQMGASEVFDGRSASVNWLREPIERRANTRDMVQKMRSGSSEIPKPVVELDRDGNLTHFQEGRNRGVAAYYADVGKMPVYFVLDRTKTGGSLLVNPPSRRRVREYLDQRRSEVFS